MIILIIVAYLGGMFIRTSVAAADQHDLRVDEVPSDLSIEELYETESQYWVVLVLDIHIGEAHLYSLDKAGAGPKKYRPVERVSGIPGSIEAMCGTNETLWLGTSKGELYELAPTGNPMRSLQFDPTIQIKALYLDGSTLWIGTEEGIRGGLYRWELGSAEHPKVSEFPSKVKAIARSNLSRPMSDAAAPPTDPLYVGTDRGLYRWRENSQTQGPLSGFGDQPIMALWWSDAGLWIGTKTELYRFSVGTENPIKVLDVDVRSLFGTSSQISIGSTRGLYQVRGGATPWKPPIIPDSGFKSTRSPGEDISIDWAIGDCAWRTTPNRILQRVIVTDSSGRMMSNTVVNGDACTRDRFNSTVRGGIGSEGRYHVSVEATDLNGITGTVELYSLSISSAPSGWLIGIFGLISGVALDLTVFIILLYKARRSKKAFDILTGPFIGKPFAYFGFAILHWTRARLWVFERYYQELKNDYDTERQFIPRKLERLDWALSGSRADPPLTTDSLSRELAERSPHVCVVGNPGSGKTEMVYSLLYRYFQEGTLDRSWRRYGFIPIVIRVRDSEPMPIDRLATIALSTRGFTFNDGEFTGRLIQLGGFLIILDGLNEGRLDDQLRKYDKPKSLRLLMTSQTSLSSTDVVHYKLPDVSDSLSKELLKVLIVDNAKKKRAEEVSPKLLEEVHSGYEIRLIAELIDGGQELPVYQLELFRLVADHAFVKASRVPRQAVCEMALSLWQTGQRAFTATGALLMSDLEALATTKILVQQRDRFEFCHDQMRDYLAACYWTEYSPSWAATFNNLRQPQIWNSVNKTDQQQVFGFLARLLADDDLRKLATFAVEEIELRVQLLSALKLEADRRGKSLQIS